VTALPRGAEDAVAREDRRLVEHIATDKDAFAQLYDRYSARAYRVARSVCRDDGRAEDAVQEAFLSVWRTHESYRPALGTVAAWLMVVVRRRAIDTSRRNRKHADHRADADQLDARPAAGGVADQAETNDEAPRLRARLAHLPEAQQEVIVLAFYGELTHAEIADHLQLPPGTVKGRMRLGLEKLRADIDQAVA
jgi:RNA polymerase sigma-70 factor, ECF subfamily